MERGPKDNSYMTNVNIDPRKIQEDITIIFPIMKRRLSAAREQEEELKKAVKAKGFLKEENAPIGLVLDINPLEFTGTDQQSSLIDIQDKIKGYKKELEENERLSLILRSLHRNEVGDAELFLELFKNKYIFDTTEGRNGEFYFWNGTYWQIDIDRQRYLDMKMVAAEYEWASRPLRPLPKS